MDDRGQGRYDRSRYVTGGDKSASSRRARGRHREEPQMSRRPRFLDGEDYSEELEYDYYELADGDSGNDSSYEADTMRFDDGDDGGSRRYSRKAAEGVYADGAKGSKRSPARRRRTRRVVIAAVAAVVVVVLVGIGAYAAMISHNLHDGVDDELLDQLVETDMANEPFYVLLLGTDTSAERDEDPEYAGIARSDSMMLARVDPVNKKATLISIGRDILVDMGEYGEEKINAAYAFGGAALAVKTVSELAGVPISHYAQIDFDGFSAMVDALGGVEVDVPISFDDGDAAGSMEAGLQVLDGPQALALCRMRNAYAEVAAHPDELRAANQRLVLAAIAKKLLSSDVGTIATTVQAMSGYVTTDLELNDIVGLAQIMHGLDSETDIYTASVPTTSQYIDEGWYEMVNKSDWAAMMKRVEAGEPPVEETQVDEATGTVIATAGTSAAAADKYATVTVKNATDISGLAAQTRSKLVDAGFVNVIVGDITDSFTYPETLVVYDDAAQERQAEQIVEIVGQGSAFENDGSYLLGDNDFIVVIGEDWDTSL